MLCLLSPSWASRLRVISLSNQTFPRLVLVSSSSCSSSSSPRIPRQLLSCALPTHTPTCLLHSSLLTLHPLPWLSTPPISACQISPCLQSPAQVLPPPQSCPHNGRQERTFSDSHLDAVFVVKLSSLIHPQPGVCVGGGGEESHILPYYNSHPVPDSHGGLRLVPGMVGQMG